MNQQCKVCGEPAAGFHFGAFTCEGCKSFFGRSYNNLSSITECKNSGECVINKKNRTACKACRLRKCLLVGMSKSGSRYGRRSNWFKIHCLLQEQQQEQQQRHQHQQQQQQQHQQQQQQTLVMHHQVHKSLPNSSSVHHPTPRTKEDSIMLGCLDDYKNSTSPSISSPESHNSDSSIEISERRAAYGLHPGFRSLHPHLPTADLSTIGKEMMNLPLGFNFGGMTLVPPSLLPPPNLSIFSPYHLYASSHHHHLQHPSMHPANLISNPTIPQPSSIIVSHSHRTPGLIVNDESSLSRNNNHHAAINYNIAIDDKKKTVDDNMKRRYSSSTLVKDQERSPSQSPKLKRFKYNESPRSSPANPDSPEQDNPIDLSMKSIDNDDSNDDDDDDNVDPEDSDRNSPPIKQKTKPIDLTTRS